MNAPVLEKLNSFLVDIFHEILKTEEQCLSRGELKNLSIRELHVIEEICLAEKRGEDNRATAIAYRQRITPGTLTTMIVQLEKKGYIKRTQDAKDKRITRLTATEKGKEANALHEEFHLEMVKGISDALSEEELLAFSSSLDILRTFFEQKYKNKE